MYKVIKFEALIKTGRFEDAARLMSDLIHLSPGAGTWCYLALAQVLRGQSDAATRSLRNGLDLSPSFRVANFADTLEFYDAENGGEHFQRGYSVLQELEQAIVE
jgi:hypothetical protein